MKVDVTTRCDWCDGDGVRLLVRDADGREERVCLTCASTPRGRARLYRHREEASHCDPARDVEGEAGA